MILSDLPIQVVCWSISEDQACGTYLRSSRCSCASWPPKLSDKHISWVFFYMINYFRSWFSAAWSWLLGKISVVFWIAFVLSKGNCIIFAEKQRHYGFLSMYWMNNPQEFMRERYLSLLWSLMHRDNLPYLLQLIASIIGLDAILFCSHIVSGLHICRVLHFLSWFHFFMIIYSDSITDLQHCAWPRLRRSIYSGDWGAVLISWSLLSKLLWMKWWFSEVLICSKQSIPVCAFVINNLFF